MLVNPTHSAASLPTPASYLAAAGLASTQPGYQADRAQLSARPAAGVAGEVVIRRRWSLVGLLCPTYDITVGGRPLGTLTRRLVALGPTYDMKDASGRPLGKVHQHLVSVGQTADITDAKGARVGRVRQELLTSLAHPSAVLRLERADGSVVARTDPQWLTYTGGTDLRNAQGESIGSFDHTNGLMLLNLTEAQDPRLVLGFVAAQLERHAAEDAAKAIPQTPPPPDAAHPTR